MPIPLYVTIPAAAAALAYLDAKSGFWYDRKMMRGAIRATWRHHVRERKNRCNSFYRLEELARDNTVAGRTFLLYNNRSWTYAQAYDMALRYGTYLRDTLGVKSKDIVAIDLHNSDNFVLVMFGLWSIGAKPAFINYNLAGEALTHCIKLAESTLMLVDPDIAHKVDDVVRAQLGDLPIAVLNREFVNKVQAAPATRAPDSCRGGEQGRDMAILIYTSGTTGLPKAAIVSWSKLIVGPCFAMGWLGMESTDTFYTASSTLFLHVCMPLYHASATVLGLALCLETGCTFAIGKKFSTKTFWKEARGHNATVVQYVGETCRYLLLAPPQIDLDTGEDLDRRHSIRAAFGNGLRADVFERFRDRFGIETIAEFYAQTEGFLALCNLTTSDYASGAMGRGGWLYSLLMRWRGVNVVAINLETDEPARDARTGFCRHAAAGEVGEMLFMIADRNDVERVYQGYYGNVEATRKKIIHGVFRAGDAFFRSGDLVSWDAEGRIYFHDRIGDTFRWKSENVSTTEVGNALGMHALVAEANAYGVQLPHHDGRAGAAVVVLRGSGGKLVDETRLNDETLRSLARHAFDRLPRYAVPIFLRISENLGHAVTGTNKQQKHDLRVQGVDPNRIGTDKLFWLRDGTYVPFGPSEWQELSAGRVKL